MGSVGRFQQAVPDRRRVQEPDRKAGPAGSCNPPPSAVALAESGDFEQAVKWEEAAMKLTAAEGDEMKGRRERLALYKDRKPYRDVPVEAEGSPASGLGNSSPAR